MRKRVIQDIRYLQVRIPILRSLDRSVGALRMVKLHRMSQRLMEAVGQSSKVTKDARFDGASKTHSQMMKDLDTLGAGLSEHLTMSHKFYKNTTTLLEVTAARCDARRARRRRRRARAAHESTPDRGVARRVRYLVDAREGFSSTARASRSVQSAPSPT